MREVTSINWYDEYLWVDETPMTGDRLPIETTPIMQYTGLKDKNGKEIYENDVIDFENGYISEIFYQDGAFKLNDNIYRSDLSHGIIIGNIYQNPELIK